MNLQLETNFFHDIAIKVRNLVLGFNGNAPISKYKTTAVDYATEVDIAVEKLIVSEIEKIFPNDQILAEEEHSDVQIPKGRIWIIDPICGTSNMGRGITNYCTNIALADNGSLVASCVVDHSQDDYFWSVGENKFYINDQLFKAPNEDLGVVIDVDFGALASVSHDQIEKHIKAAFKLLTETNYTLLSLNTSLSFAYVAISKIDGAINTYNNLWDICAASFLIQQSGGIITDLNGNPWTMLSTGFIAAKNENIHKKLLEIYSSV